MISIEFFKGVPTEYESFLIEKYGSFFTTCRYMEVYYASYEIYYMLVYEEGKLIDLLVFGNNGNTSSCFNSLVAIDQNIITACIKQIFDKYPSIKKIKIVASYREYKYKKAILYSKSDNNILELPSTMDDYYLMLGSSTRQTIKNRRVKLLKEHPEVNFVTKYGTEIDEKIINEIILSNWNRMKHKGIVPNIDSNYMNEIYKYAQHYGCVAYIEIDGVIIAGSICSIINRGIFGHVNTFDNAFSRYNPGELIAFYLIQTSIEKGLSTFHFLWGKSDLKKRLLAEPYVLFSYIIFRNYSFDYIFSKLNIVLSGFLNDLSHSKFTEPLRNKIKSYRKRKWKL